MSSVIQLERKLFRKKFQRTLEKFVEKLDDYIEDPNEENIHDIRISIRRLESATRVLPKKVRKKQEIQDYVEATKMLFRINTQIRDLDIINTKFEKQGSAKYQDLITDLKTKRETGLKQAHNLSVKLKKTPIPKIGKNEIIDLNLNKRFKKIINQLIIELKKNIPIVINDDKNIAELHQLRKDFKKLRYSIELTSDKNSTSSIKILKNLQDSLGEIHDCDIMLDYLREVKGPNELSEVIRNEILERREKYQQFVQSIHDEEINLDMILKF